MSGHTGALRDAQRVLNRYPPDNLTRLDLLHIRSQLLAALDTCASVAAINHKEEVTMPTATLTSPADLESLDATLNREALAFCVQAAIDLAEGGAAIDRAELTSNLAAAGWTAADLSRHVTELRDRKHATEDLADASATERELPAMKSKVESTAEAIRKAEAAHAEKMAPMLAAHRAAVDAFNAKRHEPHRLRTDANRLINRTMADDVRQEFDRLSDTAVRARQTAQELDRSRKSRGQAVNDAGAALRMASQELAALAGKPNSQTAEHNLRQRVESCERDLAASERQLAAVDEAAKAADEAEARFAEFKAGPMLDWRRKRFN